MKKRLGIVFVLALILSVGLSAVAYTKESESERLFCDKGGNFTILVVADPQCDTAAQWEQARFELEVLVQKSNPNLVIINGDMNSYNVIPPKMWERFVSPLTERGIFWATTNGNHDPFKNEHYRMYKSYDECLNATVGMLEENFDFSRPMNYVLPIFSNDGKKIVFAIYCMDSGQRDTSGYEGVTKKQINWYKEQSDRLREQNGGRRVTSLLCMHIPLIQTLDMYYSAWDGAMQNGKSGGGLYKIYGIANEPKFSKKPYVCENGTTVKKTKIHTTSQKNDRGMFAEILNQGDIKVVVFGHDHCTNIVGSYKGVLLGFAGKLSTGCYSDELCRGGRVVKFNQKNPEQFTTEWLGSIKTSKDLPPIYSDGTLAK